MFNSASSFSQDLSSWCVTNITTEPNFFSVGAGALTPPDWGNGTCPAP